MSTAEPLGEDQWPATGVDLETRRRRILATLTARTVPGWADHWEALRREPPALVPDDARSVEDVFDDLDLPRPG